jgi:hypothetical protein
LVIIILWVSYIYREYISTNWRYKFIQIYYEWDDKSSNWIWRQINRRFSLETSKNILLILLGINITWIYGIMMQFNLTAFLILIALFGLTIYALERIEGKKKEADEKFKRDIIEALDNAINKQAMVLSELLQPEIRQARIDKEIGDLNKQIREHLKHIYNGEQHNE